MVPARQLHDEIDERLVKGQALLDAPGTTESELRERRDAYYTWTDYNKALIRRSFDVAKPSEDYARETLVAAVGASLDQRWELLRRDISRKMRRLRSLQDQVSLFQMHPDAVQPASTPDPSVVGEDIFVVHGHDGATKETVARFLRKLVGREPVILHEQPDRGRTVIEKFEDHAALAACAIVLLTGDDVGGVAGGDQRPRARQNVVLEMGFFLGKLGRGRVVILHEADVELPSDLHGVLYVQLDTSGAWRNAVAREVQAAGVEVDLTALLST